jgi:hypothetical protein
MAEQRGFETSIEVAAGPKVNARVNRGRWLADCPFCTGAELVLGDDAVFMCLSCGNQESGGKFLLVKFPTSGDVPEIEAALMKRPERFRNWTPGLESLDDLIAENRAHGIGEV